MITSIATAPLMVLGLLSAGQTAVVESVLGGAEDTHRLREIGLRDGATVEMIRPGNPCLVRLGGQKLGLRSEALSHVLVRPES
jgi:ferrous iron transport protein A